jgi:hypothetical protein
MALSVRQAVELFIKADLLSWDRVANLQSLRPNGEFNQVALDGTIGYEEVYLTGLSLRYFNFVISDQSYFQFSEVGRSLRFAYYPNPFTNSDALLELADDPLDFDSIDLTQLKATAGRSPLRFDVAPEQYVAISHPYAHFHLGHGELGRLGSSRIYCPVTFCLLVMRLYYPEEWARFDVEVAGNGFTNEFDSRLAALLLGNGFVNVAHFCDEESRITHLR